ncbi:MAG TPA: bifunctional ADP-heptose synthase [Bacteroidales bacterium]|nr:bifunctional ADP-heptose synthase [Bacteroidales bacterium]HRZ48744.1 bifunctional ADP-heptose synthase [Bacteroidales bacterium]
MKLFTEEALDNLFESFSKMRVLIIGDVMVDAYLWGTVDRISPEAPVPVVAVTRRNNRLGGAANVALNIKSMGATPVLCSVAGKDIRGGEFLLMMQEEHMDNGGILQSSKRLTTTKFRIFGNNTQMLRVDEETTEPLNRSDTSGFHQMLEEKITRESWDVIVFQDYDKGLISSETIGLVTTLASARNIPVAVDPKRKNFMSYRNVSLFKPNLKELKEGLKSELDLGTEAFHTIVEQFQQQQHIGRMMVTLGSEGVYVRSGGIGEILPAHLRSVADVSGAGDSVISVASLCLAAGLSPMQTAAVGNLAGGLVCEEVGVVPVNRGKLRQEASKHLV